MEDGSLDYRGALTLSTPLAYSLSRWHIVIGAGAVSYDARPKFPLSRDQSSSSDGTINLMAGIPLGGAGDLTFSAMILAITNGEQSWNLHFTPGGQKGPMRFGVGMQDQSGNGGSSGGGFPGDDASSRSFYLAGTYRSEDNTYFTLGTGTRRFKGVFGSVSRDIVPRLKGLVEYDSMTWNLGIAYTLGGQNIDERELIGIKKKPITTVMYGWQNGKYSFLSFSIGF